MRSSFLAVLLVAGFTSVPALADDTMAILKPEQIGQIFCLSRTGNDEAVIQGVMTPELTTAIADAVAKNDVWETANPGEKPPLGDGLPWSTWTDYAPDCTVGLVTLMKTDAKVEIAYGFPDQPDGNYTDTLLLKKVDMADVQTSFWRIDNVAYAGGGDFRAQLLTAFEGY
jgi:hypothetical protein